MGSILPACALLSLFVAAGCGHSRTPGDGGRPPGDGGAPGDLALPAIRDGGAPGDLLHAPCPSLMALVTVPDGGTVCVDRYEAATVQIAPDGGSAPHAYDHPVDGLTVAAVVAQGVKPQAYISEVQAGAACMLAGKRLCTLDEWLAACEGPNGWTYPYGNTYEAGACNDTRASNPVNDCFGAGNNVFTYTNMNSPCCEDQPMTAAPGGSFPRCVSSWGIYDLHGNLHEWIVTRTSTGNGIFKGGFFVDAKLNGPGCHYATTAHAQSYHDYSTGFRCCADPM